ncbi:hypothetical protein ACQB60_10690, partial [Actinomycetota bacterium Odt1-20B]
EAVYGMDRASGRMILLSRCTRRSMHKRHPLLVLGLMAAFTLGTSACGPSDDKPSSASGESARTSASDRAAPSASASASAAKGPGLKGAQPAFFLKTIRDNYPDLDRIGDEELVAHGDALCTVRGAAIGDQFKKTVRELGISKKQASRITGVAHGLCYPGNNTTS